MITCRLASALTYLHSNGLVHRNLRPEIIMFESENNLYDLKIVDLLTMTEATDENTFSNYE